MAKEWEVLAVSKGREGQYYMELCDGDVCRREPIEAYQATVILLSLSRGATLYATELPSDEKE